MMDIEAYRRRTSEREHLPPIRNYDPNPSRSLFEQMEKADFLLARLVMDAEAYELIIYGKLEVVNWKGEKRDEAQCGSLADARKYLEAKGIVPESAYYGGAL